MKNDNRGNNVKDKKQLQVLNQKTPETFSFSTEYTNLMHMQLNRIIKNLTIRGLYRNTDTSI